METQSPAQRQSIRQAVGAATALLLLLAAAPARAWPWEWDETKPALRVTVGVDVFRVPGTTVASARYGGSWNAKISTWLHDAGVDPHAPKLLVGGGHVLTKWNWPLGAGLGWVHEPNNNENG